LIGGAQMKPVYERLARFSKKKLQKEAAMHQLHLDAFTLHRNSVTTEIDQLKNRYRKLMIEANTSLKTNIPKALANGMRARHVKADLNVALSVRNVVRMNEFYHRMMLILIEDIQLGVNYNPERIKDLIPQEFSDIIKNSITGTQMGEFLHDLRREIEENNQEGNL
jgi:hypothetical protein